MVRVGRSVEAEGGGIVQGLLIPFDQADEVEQSLRAERLQSLGRVAVLESQRLNAANLAAAVDQALALDTSIEIDLDGAAKSAAQIRSWLQQATA